MAGVWQLQDFEVRTRERKLLRGGEQRRWAHTPSTCCPHPRVWPVLVVEQIGKAAASVLVNDAATWSKEADDSLTLLVI